MTNLYSLQDLFTIRHSLWRGKIPKACSEWLHLASGRFIKVSYKTTTCPRQPLFSGLKIGCLIWVWLYYQQMYSWCSLLTTNWQLTSLLSAKKMLTFGAVMLVNFTDEEFCRSKFLKMRKKCICDNCHLVCSVLFKLWISSICYLPY